MDGQHSLTCTPYLTVRTRYEQCLSFVLDAKKRPDEILGGIDAKKLQSSITLFLEIDPHSDLLNNALKFLFSDQVDLKTFEILKRL